MRKNRPGSIIVVGWVTIITGIFSFLYILNLPDYYKGLGIVNNGLDLLLIMLIVSVISVIYLVCGIAILCGTNWGRISYIIFIGFVTLFSVLSNNFSIINIPYFVLYLMFLYLLLRPEANEFFRKEKKDNRIL